MNINDKIKKNSKQLENGCIVWTGYLVSGYGQITYNGKIIYVHRLVAHLKLGLDLGSNLLALHKNECHNRACINEEHLYIGNHADNMKDRLITNTNVQANKKCCPKGHSLSGENLATNKSYGRSCRICHRESNLKYSRRINATPETRFKIK